MLLFEWDQAKAEKNFHDHRVTFDEAKTVFYDENAVKYFDHDEIREDRFLIVGISTKSRALTVCFCDRNNDDVIRIISARRATAKEKRDHLERRKRI